jgi:hypothetical protein
LGTTVVECSAADAAGNTATGSFSVTVSDTTAPALSLPSSFTVVAADESGATVTWSADAVDLVDGMVPITCVPAVNTVFAVGTTAVSCSATDAAANTSTGGFDVTVEVGDPTNEPPVIQFFSSDDAFGGNVANRPVPLSRALTVLTTDPDGDALDCSLDVDGDGVFEQPVPNCAPIEPVGLPFLDGGNFPSVVIRTPGTHVITLRVSDGVNPPVEATTELTAAPAVESFDIETIVEPGLLDPDQLAELDAAIARIETMIPTGLPSRFVSYDPEEYGGWCDAFVGEVDDLTIRVTAATIDGPRNIGALGGYCASRWDEWANEPYYGINLPAYGQVILDIEDIDWWHDAGVLDELFAHEIGHALGVGTSQTWRRFTALEDTRRYTAGGLELWRNYGRTGMPPVQPLSFDGTNLTGGDHWHEDHMGDELMTPRMNFDRPAQLSDLTLSFLAEAGYSVDLHAAEPYTPPPVSSGSALRRMPTHQFGDDAFGPHSDPADRPGA